MSRWRAWLAAAALAACALAAQAETKVLRYAFLVAETGFDPAQVIDIYSRTLTPHIFEALYHYDHLARPAKILPQVAVGMPEVSSDFRTWTVKIQPGIYFADDPAFQGKRRELVAEDFVYSFKRFADPANKSAAWAGVEEQTLIGLDSLRDQALKAKKPFDYDRPIEGLRALDRYTLQFKLREPRPRFVETLATNDLFGAVAREVVEHYGDKIMEHPVGTGPFRLAAWRRSSLIVLERNPSYRPVFYDAQPAADDAEGQALLARFKGRRLPMVDRVEISIIEESQPRWLAFLNGEADFIERVPNEVINLAMPNGKLAPGMVRKGIHGVRTVAPDMTFMYFSMTDPVVGGYTPDKVALRRAVSLGYDTGREIRLLRRGQAIPAQSPVVPHTSGYDPHYKSENSEYDPAKAMALLDMFGYVDRDGDGWRDQPDGSPLLLKIATQPDQVSRQLNEQWERDMRAIGLRVAFQVAKWPENLKQARAGKLMMWSLASSNSVPDGQDTLARWYGPQAGNQNYSRFARPEFDALYDRLSALPDGPEREQAFFQAKRIMTAWASAKVGVHRIITDMSQPWMTGYRRPLFWQDWWQMVDIDTAKQPQR